MEHERLECIKDSVMRTLLYETLSFKNLQYDIERLVNKVDLFDIDKELREFLQTFETHSTMPSGLGIEKHTSFIFGSIINPQRLKQPETPENLSHSHSLRG
jgi:hypothetical protein